MNQKYTVLKVFNKTRVNYFLFKEAKTLNY